MRVPDKYIKNKADERAVDQGCWFNEAAGLKVVHFFESYVYCSAGRDAGKLVKLLPWQRDDLIMPLYSWYRPDNTRRYRTGYISCSKKNGKTFICAGLSLYHLVADGEVSANIVSAASSREQASLIYNELWFSINQESNKELAASLKPYPSRKEIHYPAMFGSYKALSKAPSSKHGFSNSLTIVDEFAFHTDHAALYHSLKLGGGGRVAPLFLIITTAGHDRSSVCYEQYQYAKKISQNVITDPSFFSLIYEADEGCNILDESQWEKANPSIDVAVKRSEFQEMAEAAQHSKTAEVEFRQKKLNNWCQSVNTFLSLDNWNACKGTFPSLEGKDMVIGIDLASRKDLCGLVGIVQHEGKYYIFPHAWCPMEGVRKREKSNLVKYKQFETEGTLTITPGNGVDYAAVRAYISELNKKFKVREIVIEYHEANETTYLLRDAGFNVGLHGTSIAHYNDPTKLLETCVLDRKLVHQGETILQWQAQNLQVKKDEKGRIAPTKERSVDKIDLMVALIIALSRAPQFNSYTPKVIADSKFIFC